MAKRTDGNISKSMLVPEDTNSEYGIIDTNDAKGGPFYKNTLTERNAIKTGLRTRGCLCYVVETDTYYILRGGITNAHWDVYALSTVALNNQIAKQASDLLSRDTMYGINLRHTYHLTAAASALKPLPTDTFPLSVPYSSGSILASQTGNVVTAVNATSVFDNAHIGKRIIFANGQSARITGLVNPTVDGNPPILQITVDRPQTVASQTFRIQASGVCVVAEGDSISESNKTSLRCMMYRQWGYGGTLIGPTCDSTIARTEAYTLAGGVTTVTTAFDCAPAGFVWRVPVNGTVEGWINAKYRDGDFDYQTQFDIPQHRRKTDCCTVIWKRKAGAKLKIEARLHENGAQTDGWILLADNVDAGAGSEYLAWIDLPHSMGVCWHYKVTVTEDTGGGGVDVVGIYTENREQPGAVWVSWNTGGMKMSDSMTIDPSALKVLNWILRIDARFYEYRDYGEDGNGNGTGQVPDLPARINTWRQKWVDAGVKATHIYIGGYPNLGDTSKYENWVYRNHCLQTGDPFVDIMSLYATYNEALTTGVMKNADTVHGNLWVSRTIGAAIGIMLGLFEDPFATDGRDVDAQNVNATRLLADGEDVALAIEAAKAGPWANGVFNRSTSGYAAWAQVPAPGTTGYAVQIWIEIPKTNPSATIPLFGFYASESVSVAAGNADCFIDTSGRLTLSFRNIANTGYSTYRLGGAAKTPGDFIRKFGGRRGCLTIIVDPSKPHPQAWFETTRVNNNASPTYSATASVTVERITDPINIPGVNFNVGITGTHYARQIAYWTGGPLPTWEGELKRNAERGFVGGLGSTAPAAYWVASTGAGRYIRDISGNGRHVKLGGSSPTGVNGRNNPGDGLTVGYAWLKPRAVRTTFVMTSNAGMVPQYGEDIYVDISAGSGVIITLPAIADPDGGEIRIWGKGTYLPRIAQQGAATQIVTGLGTTDGLDRTTAGPTGYLQMGQRYTMLSLKALTADLWMTPSLPPGSTLAIASSASAVLEAASITGARVAGLMGGGVQSFGEPYAPWATIPALGTGGFTVAWTGLVPRTIPGALIRMVRTTPTRTVNNTPGCMDVGFTTGTGGRLAVLVRNSANTGAHYWYLNNFVTNYAGRIVRITVRFDPQQLTPEVWVEGTRVDGTGNMTWAEQDSGTAPYPTMLTADLSGTYLSVGCIQPCYQLALWSGMLPDNEIAENQINGRWTGNTAPLCCYEFMEGTGRISADLSGNERTVRFLNSGNSNNDLNDSGNGVTTGVRWLRRKRRSGFTVSSVDTVILRPGDSLTANEPTVRRPCTLASVVDVNAENITVQNIGAAGFEITLPTGHKAVTGAGVTVGTDATSAGGKITSSLLYSTVTLRPIIVNSSTDVTWLIVAATGVTLT